MWDAVATGLPVNFYKVRYRKFGTASWAYIQTTNTSTTLTGLESGAYYEFRVQTNCGNGILSAASDFKRWTMTVCQSPAYESIIATPDPCAPRNALISWTPPANASVDRYKILYRKNSDPAGVWQAKYTPADGGVTTEKLLSQLELGTYYKVRVKTWCTGGEKSFLYSGFGEFTTFADNSGCGLKLAAPTIIGIFPNPVNDALNINYSMEEDAQVSVTVTDLLGRTVMTRASQEFAGSTNTSTLDVSKLQNGYYFISVEANGEVSTHKFVKQ
jgi:hypothetical protein